jgi:hypothetical protein
MIDCGSWLQYASRIGFRLVRIAHNLRVIGRSEVSVVTVSPVATSEVSRERRHEK